MDGSVRACVCTCVFVCHCAHACVAVRVCTCTCVRARTRARLEIIITVDCVANVGDPKCHLNVPGISYRLLGYYPGIYLL